MEVDRDAAAPDMRQAEVRQTGGYALFQLQSCDVSCDSTVMLLSMLNRRHQVLQQGMPRRALEYGA